MAKGSAERRADGRADRGAPRLVGRLSATDLQALGAWLLTRAGLVVLTIASGWQLRESTSFTERWDRWDVGLFRKAAEFGYDGFPENYPDPGIHAFFPGFPAVLKSVHWVVPSWTAAGLLISLVAGAFAAVALSRLAELDGVPGPRAVTVWVLSPYAVFLAAGYSEALFLAFALPGWLAARRGDWRAAGILVGLATAVRISGLFLAVGLIVHYLVTVTAPSRPAPSAGAASGKDSGPETGDPARDLSPRGEVAGTALAVRARAALRPEALWLLTPFAVLAAWFGYLWHLSGDPLRWTHVQEEYWSRSLTPPWESFDTTFDAMRFSTLGPEYQWSFGAEIVAVLIGVALTVVLVRRAHWGEAVYVGLSVAALATSSFYLSVARATLLWFPLWILLAQAGTKRPALHTAYLAVAVPLMVVTTLTFTSGKWVG